MAYLVQRTSTRPNTNVKFFQGMYPEDIVTAKQIVVRFLGEGKLLSESSSVSNDKLIYSYSALWSSLAAHEEFLSDETLKAIWVKRKSYNIANGITVTVTKLIT
jgi:hypothetical protein